MVYPEPLVLKAHEVALLLLEAEIYAYAYAVD